MSDQISQEFRSLAADLQAAVDSAPQYSDFEPPATPEGSSYSCLFKGVKAGVKTADNGVKSTWVRVDLEIVDGEYEGQSFGILFSSKMAWKFTEFFKLVSMLTNEPAYQQTRQVLPAVEAAAAAAGKYLIRLTAKSRATSSGTFVNYYFEEVLDSVTV